MDFEEAMREAAQHFDQFHLFTHQEKYLRGRTRSEIIDLLSKGLRSAGVSQENIFTHRSQDEALGKALSGARPGDLVVVAPLSDEEAWQQVRSYRSAYRYRTRNP